MKVLSVTNLVKNLDVIVLEESSLVLRFSETFLVDLKMSSELMECFAFVWFWMFCLANIWQKVWEHFSHSSSFLILVQIFGPFDCLHFSWCNFYWEFSVIGLNSGKFFSLFRSILIEKDGACLFLVQDFVYSNKSLVEEWLFFTFLSWKSNFLHTRRKHAYLNSNL